jgi:hypothetical protein
MSIKTYQISNPKTIIEEMKKQIKIKDQLKNKFLKKQILQHEEEKQIDKIFKPIIESNEKLKNQLMEDNKVLNIADNFKKLEIKREKLEKGDKDISKPDIVISK